MRNFGGFGNGGKVELGMGGKGGGTVMGREREE